LGSGPAGRRKGRDDAPRRAAILQRSASHLQGSPFPVIAAANRPLPPRSAFLIDRKGHVVARFAPKVEPESEEVVKAIEEALAE
jgi:hypothetical protein